MKKKLKKFIKIVIKIILPIFAIAVILSFLTYGQTGVVKPVIIEDKPVEIGKELTLLSINMAHGRGDGRSQILQSKETINKFVNKIGLLIQKENAQIVALQESDAPSWWSGGYSHVKKVAKLSNMHFAVQAKHVDGIGLHYGASLIGKPTIISAYSQTFDKSIPTFSKGFTMATVKWGEMELNVISLHLDFTRDSVRESQLSLLASKIKESGKPVIISGDFNSDLSKPYLVNFMKKLKLSTWKPNAKDIVTFPGLGGSRIDWILVSAEFEITSHTVLDEIISDHKAVKVTIKKVSNTEF